MQLSLLNMNVKLLEINASLCGFDQSPKLRWPMSSFSEKKKGKERKTPFSVPLEIYLFLTAQQKIIPKATSTHFFTYLSSSLLEEDCPLWERIEPLTK